MRAKDRTFAPMMVLLSPAKDLDMSPAASVTGTTMPRFLDQSERLMAKLRTLSAKQVAKLMDLSPKLAALNQQRYQDWHLPFTPVNAKPAILAFNGDVYRGLNAPTLAKEDLRSAQQHVRVLSGLYGLLRPLDLMQAYRLEMGSGFSVGRRSKDLYAFWGDRITQAINEDLEAADAKAVVNLSSNEYFKSVQPQKLRARVITAVFKDKTPAGYKALMLFAKLQRGRMCRWINDNRLTRPVDLDQYNADGYRFAPDMSSADERVFIRDRR